jgi:ABC-type transport system substrate-binding protein
MNEQSRSNQLSPQATDYVTAAAKAVFGMVPFVGSLLAELAGTIIPNQRIDRIVKFAEARGWLDRQDSIMYTGLVGLDREGNPVPELAERWEVRNDART